MICDGSGSTGSADAGDAAGPVRYGRAGKSARVLCASDAEEVAQLAGGDTIAGRLSFAEGALDASSAGAGSVKCAAAGALDASSTRAGSVERAPSGALDAGPTRAGSVKRAATGPIRAHVCGPLGKVGATAG